MKPEFLQKKLRLLALSLCFLTIFSSCEDEDTKAPFEGTWAAIGIMNIDSISFVYNDIMKFNNGSFENIGQIKNPTTSQWINFVGLKGSFIDNKNSMTLTIKEVGVSSLDMFTGVPTGNIIYYKSGQTEFKSLLSNSGLKETFKSEYSLSGKSLTIRTDQNNDGDYTDTNETTVYSKQ